MHCCTHRLLEPSARALCSPLRAGYWVAEPTSMAHHVVILATELERTMEAP